MHTLDFFCLMKFTANFFQVAIIITNLTKNATKERTTRIIPQELLKAEFAT